jgi:hypothetical protein
LASIFQVAKSARALVSARRAINMSAALIKMASAFAALLVWLVSGITGQ